MRFFLRKEFFGGIGWDAVARDYFMFPLGLLEILKDSGKINVGGLLIDNDFELSPAVELNECPGFPLRVHLAISDHCNTTCQHCFFDQVPPRVRRDGTIMSTEVIFELIEEMRRFGCMELFLGGGEPLLRPDWFDILRHADRNGVQTFVFTNGVHANAEAIAKLNTLDNLGYLSISLEGTNKKEYSITRSHSLWEKVVENLGSLGRIADFPVYVRYTATSANIESFRNLVDFVSSVGLGRVGIKVRPILPTGRSTKNSNLLIDYKDYLRFLCNIKKEIDSRIEISLSTYKDADPRKSFYRFSRKTIGFSRFIPLYTGFGGSGGYTSVYIDPYGNIQDCVMTYGHFGGNKVDNICHGGLYHQWRHATPILAKRALTGNEECASCEHYIWCRGGCRARAIYWNKDQNAKDPWCLKDLIATTSADEVNQLLEQLNEE